MAGTAAGLNHLCHHFGERPAEPFNVSVYISRDVVLDPGDTLIASKDFSGLFPVESAPGFRVRYYSGRSLIGWYMIVSTDSKGQVEEGNEDNNIVTRYRWQILLSAAGVIR